VGIAREVGGELAAEQADLAADRSPQRRYATVALARYEAEVQGVLVNIAQKDRDRCADHTLLVAAILASSAEQPAQAAEGLIDQRQAEVVHVLEVAIEACRGDSRLARDLAQAQAAEGAVVEQPQRRVEQRFARTLLALGPPLSARRSVPMSLCV
jgi:hypothetical protein